MFLKLLRTVASYILFILLVLLFAIPFLIFTLLPARWRYENKLCFWLLDIFYKMTLKFTFLPIEFVGKENIPKEPAIIAANHQSALDIPLVGSLFNGYPHIWMAWSRLKTYWMGIFLRRMAVLVDVSSPMKAMKSLVKAIKLAEGKKFHLIIFPEGSRSEGNEVHDFFAGFVILAKKIKCPVVPVLILNAYEVYPPGSFFINMRPIKVIVGKPFYYKEGDSDEEFKRRVHRWFVDEVEAYKE